jgi:superfamily II DNA or RNA helicase
LAEQWVDRAKAMLPGVSVTKVQGTTCDTSGDIVVGMLQTISQKTFPPSTFANVGLLVVDEVHHIAAEMFSKAMFGLALPKVLGLSATPTRKDGLTKVIHWFFGPISYEAARSAASNVTVHLEKYRAATPLEMPLNRRGDVCYATLTSSLVNDAARTDLIVDLVVQKLEGRDTLVLSHRRDHCKTIAEKLRDKGVDAQCFIGGQGNVPPSSKIVVSTYALTSEGFDLPRLSALVLATPASDVVQATGRVLRNPNQGAVILDIADDFPIAYAQLSKRRAFYKKSGFSIGGGRHATTSNAASAATAVTPAMCMFV